MTLVVDASAVTAMVLGRLRDDLWTHATSDGDWVAPEHLTVEVAQALRGIWLGGALSTGSFATAVQRLADAPVATHPVRPLLPRVVELAAGASAYDAAYVALAERIDVPLLTLDVRLTRLPGARCEFLA